MSTDSADVWPMIDCTDAGPQWANTKVRCHYGNQSINETRSIDFWYDVCDAKQNGTHAEWQDQVDLVAAEFSHTWDAGWTAALAVAAELFKV